jgi:ferredoxin
MFDWFTKKPKILSLQEQEQLSPAQITVEGLGNATWHKGQNLLETLEQAGFPVRHSCRKGNCGACTAEIIDGSVGYLHPVSFENDKQEVLLCAAVPRTQLTIRLGSKTLKR